MELEEKVVGINFNWYLLSSQEESQLIYKRLKIEEEYRQREVRQRLQFLLHQARSGSQGGSHDGSHGGSHGGSHDGSQGGSHGGSQGGSQGGSHGGSQGGFKPKRFRRHKSRFSGAFE